MALDGVNGQQPIVNNGNSVGNGVNQTSGDTPTPVDLTKAKAKTTDAAFEQSGLAITREDVKANQDGIRTSGATKDRVAATYNEYAKTIYDTCAGAPPELKALAQQYIAELPKSSRRADLQAYRAQCTAKLEGFRSAVRDAGMGKYLQAMEEANDIRYEATKQNIDQTGLDVATTVVSTGAGVVKEVNEHSDANTKDVKQTIKKSETNINRNTNRQVGSAVRRINNHTTQVGKQSTADNLHNLKVAVGLTPDNQPAVGKAQQFTDGTSVEYRNTINGHTTVETDRGVAETLQNQRAIHGVDEKNQPLKPGSTAKTTDGETIRQQDTTLGRITSAKEEIKTHTTKTAEKATLEQKQLAVLQSKRQAISDMLNHEERDGMRYWGSALPNTYRDATVKWLGGTADKVFADQELSFEKKQEALDELTRMVDEENIISAADKKEFEAKYFYDTREHRHL